MFFVVCDGLKGLPDVMANAWPTAIVQAYIGPGVNDIGPDGLLLPA
jgi:transposase-like protein